MRTGARIGAAFLLLAGACVSHVPTQPDAPPPQPTATPRFDAEAVRHQDSVPESARDRSLDRARSSSCLGERAPAVRSACKLACADDTGAARCTLRQRQCITANPKLAAVERDRKCEAVLDACVAQIVPEDVTMKCRDRCVDVAARQECP